MRTSRHFPHRRRISHFPPDHDGEFPIKGIGSGMKTDPARMRRHYEFITWQSEDLPIHNSISPRHTIARTGAIPWLRMGGPSGAPAKFPRRFPGANRAKDGEERTPPHLPSHLRRRDRFSDAKKSRGEKEEIRYRHPHPLLDR